MTSLVPWDEEHAAGNLFTQINGGTWHSVDVPGAPAATYDIRVELPDGKAIALEVTQDSVSAIREQHAAESKFDWASSIIDGHWYVSVDEPIKARNLHREVFELIARLRRSGSTSLIVRPKSLTTDLERDMHRLGIRAVYLVADDIPGYVSVNSASRGGTTGPSLLIEVAEDHANRADNAKKLAIDSVDERHLWIWVTAERNAQTAAIRGHLPPNRSPVVPGHVDSVWIAAAFITPVIWRWNRQEGWTPIHLKTGTGQASSW
jgi:hypothetical protein